MVHDLPKLHSGRTGARLALRPAALGGGFWTLCPVGHRSAAAGANTYGLGRGHTSPLTITPLARSCWDFQFTNEDPGTSRGT